MMKLFSDDVINLNSVRRSQECLYSFQYFVINTTIPSELIHTFFIPSRSQAILGITNKEMLMYNHVHEKDVCTMSEALCKIIKVKEEEIIFKPLDKTEEV